MQDNRILKLALGLTSALVFVILLLFILFYFKILVKYKHGDSEKEKRQKEGAEAENLVTFQGGEELEVADILEAPGEVIGKSSHGTLYKALLPKSNAMRLLRFLRPLSIAKSTDLGPIILFLGSFRNPNLVPLLGVYTGLRGEKLLVYPFYSHGNLSQFIRVGIGNAETHRWAIIYNISLGIAKGLDHLHTAYEKPIIHANLKSKNILLGRNYDPFVSDFSLHLLLNPTSGKELLDALAMDGYKAPELIKIRDVNEETDVYSYGVILLELLTEKEPINEKSSLPNLMKAALLKNGILDWFHTKNVVNEDQILKLVHLAMAGCSDSPALRPSMKQVISKLEEIGK